MIVGFLFGLVIGGLLWARFGEAITAKVSSFIEEKDDNVGG
jgi:hypothetical protein